MHLLIDGYMVSSEESLTVNEISAWLGTYPERIDMTVIAGPVVRMFPETMTGIVVIAESHISIHLNRKTRAVHVDVFSCKPFDNRRVEADVTHDLRLKTVYSRVFVREGDFLADPVSAERALEMGAEKLV